MIYFDNAATGFPKSKAVLAAMESAFHTCGNAGRSGHPAAVAASEAIYNCREALAKFLSADSEKIILTANATMALNIAIKGAVSSGNIFISPLEHNSVTRPLYALSKSENIKIKALDFWLHDDVKTLEYFEKSCKNGISAVVITHASNICGKVLPVEKIAEIAKRHGAIVIVDAAQSIGHIKIDLSKSNIDILCFSGHKGLYGPLGTGAMVINKKFDKKIKTIIEGGSGIASFGKSMPFVLPERFEPGTQNAVAFAGLSAAVNEHEFSQNEKQVFEYLLDKLNENKKIKLIGAPSEKSELYTPVILFNVDGMGCEEVGNRLSEKEICVRSGYHCAPYAHKFLKTGGGVRISAGRDSTFAECDALMEALNEIVS